MSIRHSPRFSSSNSFNLKTKRVQFDFNNTRKSLAERNTSNSIPKEKIAASKFKAEHVKLCKTKTSRTTRNSDKVKSNEESSIDRVPSPKKKKTQNKEDKPSRRSLGVSKNEPNKPETKSKKYTTGSNKIKENKLKKQMKLGKIFVKPNFPIKSIIKKNINASDNVEKQGQTVTKSFKSGTNNLLTNMEPKIVLYKVDHQPDVTNVRVTRSNRRR